MAGQTAEFQLSEEDYRSASLLHLSGQRWIYLLAVAAFLLFGLRDLPHRPWVWSAPLVIQMVVFGMTLAILLAVLAVARHVGVQWQTHRYFDQHKSMRRPRKVSWDADHLTTEGTDFMTRTPWTDVRKWRENKKVVTLYVTDRMFHILPKRVFAPPQLADILSTIKEKVAPRPGTKAIGA